MALVLFFFFLLMLGSFVLALMMAGFYWLRLLYLHKELAFKDLVWVLSGDIDVHLFSMSFYKEARHAGYTVRQPDGHNLLNHSTVQCKRCNQ